jgi:RNA recognition motif-containing protein
LNDINRKTWSKHTPKTTKILKASDKGLIEVDRNAENNKIDGDGSDKKSKKEKKLEMLLGDLKDDEGFKEFLAANKAIKSKDSIWKNDTNLNTIDKNAERKSNKEENSKASSSKETGEDKNEPSHDETKETSSSAAKKAPENDIDFENGRLFIRNLCYTCKEEDLEKLFEPYGPLVEVAMPIDNFSKQPKGFAYITCMFPEKAIKAFNNLDGSIYQGRMLHIIPAKSKSENDSSNNESFKNSSTFKSKKEAELKKQAQSSHNWNSLFINQDSVANLMASKYNINKSDIFDVHQTSKKNAASTAVKLAVGETQIVNDIRKFLQRNGVKLDAFSSTRTERSKTCVLIKNLPDNTTENELKDLFSKCNVNENTIKRFVIPEYGIAALVEFSERQEARDAFKKLAYRKFKSLPIYLEWAPVDVFDGTVEKDGEEEQSSQNDTQKEKSVRYFNLIKGSKYKKLKMLKSISDIFNFGRSKRITRLDQSDHSDSDFLRNLL